MLHRVSRSQSIDRVELKDLGEHVHSLPQKIELVVVRDIILQFYGSRSEILDVLVVCRYLNNSKP